MLKSFLTCSLIITLFAGIGCSSAPKEEAQPTTPMLTETFLGGPISYQMTPETQRRMRNMEDLQNKKLRPSEEDQAEVDRLSLYYDADLNKDGVITEEEGQLFQDRYSDDFQRRNAGRAK